MPYSSPHSMTASSPTAYSPAKVSLLSPLLPLSIDELTGEARERTALAIQEFARLAAQCASRHRLLCDERRDPSTIEPKGNA